MRERASTRVQMKVGVCSGVEVVCGGGEVDGVRGQGGRC